MSASIVASSVISDKFTVFIDLNTVLDKLRAMLSDDSIPTVDKIQAVSNFQTLLSIRMTIISKLMPFSYVFGCESLKKELDGILNEIKDLLVSGHKDEVLEELEKLGTFKSNDYIYCFKFDTLRDEASRQINTIDIDVVKLLVSASIYVQKLELLCNKFIEEDDDETFSNIVDLINNYFIVITERINLIKANCSISDAVDEYLNMLTEIHELINNPDINRNYIKHELRKFVSQLIPGSLSTKSMVILVGGVVESNKYSLY